MSGPWDLLLPGSIKRELWAHLFRPDGDEHGAVITAGIVKTTRGTRLLVREFIPARDGIDFLPGHRGHRRLTAEFVNEQILRCRDQGLAYLAVHNHGGTDAVSFSPIDDASHERGYPALLDIARGQPVGAIVVAERAVAGDIWTPDGQRHALRETIVVDANIERLYPAPLPAAAPAAAIDDRQARIYGPAGQALFGRLKVGILGAGGVGSLLVEYLARLGVGRLVVVDPERLEPSNLPRIPGARARDAHALLASERSPSWLQAIAARTATKKVTHARRIAQRARPGVRVDALHTDIADPSAGTALIDCDYIFLAADTHQARAVFNALVHQYLIPGVQIGSKVSIDELTGRIDSIRSVVRPVSPDHGCLWCNGLVNPGKLQEEAVSGREREAQRYLPHDDAPAPSVMTLNAIGASFAANEFMLAMAGLRTDNDDARCYRILETRSANPELQEARSEPTCLDCGPHDRSRRARGDAARLPIREHPGRSAR